MGYLFGQRVGPSLFKRPDSRFFKQANVEQGPGLLRQARPRAIVLARFVPIVRTFAPIIAGVSNMDYRTFVRWNVIGGTIWAFGVTLLGYFLGQVEVIEENLELAILVVVAISLPADRLRGAQGPPGEAPQRGRRRRPRPARADPVDLLDEARHPDGKL